MSPARRSLAAIAFALTAGCSAAGPAPGEPGQAERFVGRWFVEETEPHALYSASTYAFGVEGELALVWNADLVPEPHGYVRSPDLSIRCPFGDAWHAADDQRLVIASDCSDGVARDIELVFASDAASNQVGATVVIDRVGGEPGWAPPQWGWSFRKCAGDADPSCSPSL